MTGKSRSREPCHWTDPDQKLTRPSHPIMNTRRANLLAFERHCKPIAVRRELDSPSRPAAAIGIARSIRCAALAIAAGRRDAFAQSPAHRPECEQASRVVGMAAYQSVQKSEEVTYAMRIFQRQLHTRPRANAVFSAADRSRHGKNATEKYQTWQRRGQACRLRPGLKSRSMGARA